LAFLFLLCGSRCRGRRIVTPTVGTSRPSLRSVVVPRFAPLLSIVIVIVTVIIIVIVGSSGINRDRDRYPRLPLLSSFLLGLWSTIKQDHHDFDDKCQEDQDEDGEDGILHTVQPG